MNANSQSMNKNYNERKLKRMEQPQETTQTSFKKNSRSSMTSRTWNREIGSTYRGSYIRRTSGLKGQAEPPRRLFLILRLLTLHPPRAAPEVIRLMKKARSPPQRRKRNWKSGSLMRTRRLHVAPRERYHRNTSSLTSLFIVPGSAFRPQSGLTTSATGPPSPSPCPS